MVIPPLAFVGWTMLQKSTAFDAIALLVPGGISDAPRYAIAVIGAIVISAGATVLSYQAAKK
jgi:hypothetical protein